jgi:hypothetical protein
MVLGAFGVHMDDTLGSIEELDLVVREGGFPIVYMGMWLLQGGLSGQYHSVVVIGVDSDSVTVLDPQVGERRLPQGDFQAAWAAMRFLTIVIGV